MVMSSKRGNVIIIVTNISVNIIYELLVRTQRCVRTEDTEVCED